MRGWLAEWFAVNVQEAHVLSLGAGTGHSRNRLGGVLGLPGRLGLVPVSSPGLSSSRPLTEPHCSLEPLEL